jgi:HAE1 family hydrophobic/amphiphilic exporter-1
LSAFNALSLSPALAALILKPKEQRGGLLARFFAWFNSAFERATNGYVWLSGVLLRKSVFALGLLLACGAFGLLIGGRLPTSFVPDEDQGYFYVNIQLPNAASLQRTEQVTARVEDILAKTPGVQSTIAVTGFSLLSYVRTSYNAFVWIQMKDWADRTKREEQLQAVKARLNREFGRLPEAVAFSISPPAIPGVGTSGGFTFILEDRSGSDIQFLSDNLSKFMAAARQRPEIANLTTTFVPSVPQQFVAVDRDKVIKQGVAVNDVYRTIQAFMGGLFINYFNRFGRQWQVYIEAEADYRSKSENVGQFYVRNAAGDMVPLSSITRFEKRSGPEFTMRFNEYRSAQLNGAAAAGYSTDQAMKALEDVFEQTMPAEMGYDYSGMSFQEKKAQQGVSPSLIFGFSLLFVFLILAALYESWTLPFSVLLSTPVAVFGAFGFLWLRRAVLAQLVPAYMLQIENDVYSQIGLVMLIGLAAKNAILIVEFAKDEFEKGTPLAEAALRGARLRLRPILMTSFAFILGCVPLAIASGAGAISRQIMGTTVIGGMLAASMIGVFLIPALFYLVERVSKATVPAPLPAQGD